MEHQAKLPSVQVSLLKRRRKRAIDNAKSAKNNTKAKRIELRKNRHKGFKPVEYFIRRKLSEQKDSKRLERLKSKKFVIKPEDEGALIYVHRFKPTQGTDPTVHRALKLIRLTKVNTGVFMRLNPAVRRLLAIVEPYVTWGKPSCKSVNDLIYKRGHCFFNGTRTPINSNELVECMLGDKNMICIEDLVHEIITKGKNFEYCCQFLCPFRLNTPPGGWKRTPKNFMFGGEFGYRGEKINDLLARIV